LKTPTTVQQKSKPEAAKPAGKIDKGVAPVDRVEVLKKDEGSTPGGVRRRLKQDDMEDDRGQQVKQARTTPKSPLAGTYPGAFPQWPDAWTLAVDLAFVAFWTAAVAMACKSVIRDIRSAME
jgi:hypothetical protein